MSIEPAEPKAENAADKTEAAPTSIPLGVPLGPEHWRIMKTLVIVDNTQMMGIFRTVLDQLGFQYVRYGNSAENITNILVNEQVDLIVLDDFAPLDGVAFLKMLRHSKTIPNTIPVIFITAVAERARIMAARDAGANEIVLKPFSVVQLHARLSSSLRKPRGFVESSSYVGPDRRRKKDDGTAVERRTDGRGSPEQRRQSEKKSDLAWEIDI